MSWKGLGAQLKALRDRRGYSRESLAKRAAVSAVYVKKLEAGDRVSPSFEVLKRLAEALDATLIVRLVANRRRRGRV